MMAETKWNPDEQRVIDAAQYILDLHRPVAKYLTRTCAVCSCTYATHVHQLSHPGSDCGKCGWKKCPAFIRSTYLSRAWRRWQNRKAVGA